MDAVGGDLDSLTPRKENKSFTRYFGSCSDGVGDRSREHHTLGLETSKVHTNDLARVEHPQIILTEVKRQHRTQTCRDGF